MRLCLRRRIALPYISAWASALLVLVRVGNAKASNSGTSSRYRFPRFSLLCLLYPVNRMRIRGIYRFNLHTGWYTLVNWLSNRWSYKGKQSLGWLVAFRVAVRMCTRFMKRNLLTWIYWCVFPTSSTIISFLFILKNGRKVYPISEHVKILGTNALLTLPKNL